MADLDLILRSSLPVAVPRTQDRGLIGEIKNWAGILLPTGFVWCDGDDYSTLTAGGKQNLAKVLGGTYASSGAASISVTSGSSLLTRTSHGYVVGDCLIFATGTTIFNELDAANWPGSNYPPLEVCEIVSANTFRLAVPGSTTALVATSTGSKTCYEIFNVPDLRGRAVFGRDDMGGTDANRLTTATSDGDILGVSGGSETHTLLLTEIPAHTHTTPFVTSAVRGTGGSSTAIGGSTASGSAGGGGSHNNMPPYSVTNFIIRYA